MQPARPRPWSALAKEVAVSTTADTEFGDFMRGRWPAMVRLAYALTGDAGHAEDVAQAAFARAYASWGRVKRAGDPDAYVRRILINENRKRFRKHRVPEDLHGDLSGTLAASEAASEQQGPEERQALLDALGRLGPRQRAVLVLRYWLDMSEAETAVALHCSVGTVKSQASRALATLRGDASWATGTRTAGDQDIVEGGRR
jgi:RNA polymerase sigma-70 factor (sigma-E family)